MVKDRILVIGCSGQIGVELTLALRAGYGNENVIASDSREEHEALKGTGPFIQLNVINKERLRLEVAQQGITQIYLLAAMLSATGEQNPAMAWQLNVQGLLNVLDIARDCNLEKVFWPSSIAIFGPSTPKEHTPQSTTVEPVTVYGISKYAGELWCQYYFEKYGVDVRSLRYPGLISYKSAPGGGTTDYAIDIFHAAIKQGSYSSFLSEDTRLPMMYMPDAVRAIMELMETPASDLTVRTSYNLGAMSFSPAELAGEIVKILPDFKIDYRPDYRQAIAGSWPASIDDSVAARDWGWQPQYDLDMFTTDMMRHLSKQLQPIAHHKLTTRVSTPLV